MPQDTIIHELQVLDFESFHAKAIELLLAS